MEDIEHLIEELACDSSPELELSTDDSLFSPINSDNAITTTNNSSQDPGFMDFTGTKSGKSYSNSVRKLYYTLLSSGVPVSKIENLVKNIVKWSNPSVDVSMCEDKSVPESKLKYYQQCHQVQLQRQVGNLYFVTACNASNIIFLMFAAIEFME